LYNKVIMGVKKENHKNIWIQFLSLKFFSTILVSIE
jgi:hypothetical protein